MVKNLTASTVLGLLKQGGLALSAIKIVDSAGQSAAANAFVRNLCDYYTGALPKEARRLSSHEFKGAYVAEALQGAFGPGAMGQVFSSTNATTRSWLETNQDIAKELAAIWNRATRYLLDKPEKATPIIASAIKVSSGGVFSPTTVQRLMTQLLTFLRIQQAKSLHVGKSSYYFFAFVNNLSRMPSRSGRSRRLQSGSVSGRGAVLQCGSR